MAEMKRFFCPYCDTELSSPKGDTIYMSGRLCGPHFSVTIQFDIPAGLGDYGARWSENVALEEGALVEFLCPQCHHVFTTSYDERLAEIKMTEGDKVFVVVFNRTYGEHSTFVIDYVEKEPVASFGEHADDYIHEFGKNLNFFGH